MLKGCLLTFGRLILSVGRRSCDEIIGSHKKSGQFVKGEIEMNRLFEAITNDAVLSEPWAELGITRRKILQYLSLFWVLWVIYSICLSSYYKFLMAEPAAGFGFGDVMKPLIGPCLISTSLRWPTPTRPGVPAMPLELFSVYGLRCILAFRSNMTNSVYCRWLFRWPRLSSLRSLLIQLGHFANQNDTTT